MLTREDFQSPTWLRLMEHLEARKSALREQLERVDLERPQTDHARTLILRARLNELKELQALARPAPADARPATPGDDLRALN